MKKVCLVTESNNINTNQYLSVIRVLLKRNPSFDILRETPKEDYDAIIYDYIPKDVIPDSIFYIVRAPLEDFSLGVVDNQNIEFKQKISNAINNKFNITPLFINEDHVVSSDERIEQLSNTDWVVIRELEKIFLQDTEIGEARRFLREVKNKLPSELHEF